MYNCIGKWIYLSICRFVRSSRDHVNKELAYSYSTGVGPV